MNSDLKWSLNKTWMSYAKMDKRVLRKYKITFPPGLSTLSLVLIIGYFLRSVIEGIIDKVKCLVRHT